MTAASVFATLQSLQHYIPTKLTMSIEKILVVLMAVSHALGSESNQKKRGVFDGNFFAGDSFGESYSASISLPAPIVLAKPIWKTYPPISPAEIAAAISSAKEANTHVMEAQQRVQMAKESVLNQQRIAGQKEAQAAFALQKAEATAAVGRQEANAAATAVVLAQQRLAQAKSDVAEQQRMAANKEARAALIIHKSAAAAAADIQRTEDAAAKIAAIQKSQATAALKHVSASKDASITATSAAVAASTGQVGSANTHPWASPDNSYYVSHWG